MASLYLSSNSVKLWNLSVLEHDALIFQKIFDSLQNVDFTAVRTIKTRRIDKTDSMTLELKFGCRFYLVSAGS